MSGLQELEARLRDLSHNTDALQVIQEFAAGLKKTKQRQEVFNAPGALILPPIRYEEAMKRNLVPAEEDAFALLQGDIIATEAAYFMGERLVGLRLLVANATCDLVPGRRNYAALLPVQPIYPGQTQEEQDRTKRLLAELLTFKSTRRMYLPPLPGDPDDVIANAVEFDGIAQARLSDVLLAERIASLSLVGWRIFASHLRAILARAGESETRLRGQWQ
jgi:hypothetical protein